MQGSGQDHPLYDICHPSKGFLYGKEEMVRMEYWDHYKETNYHFNIYEEDKIAPAFADDSSDDDFSPLLIYT